MTSTLPRDCPHARIEARGLLSSIQEGSVEHYKPCDRFRDHETAWCRECDHFVRRAPRTTKWEAFKTAQRLEAITRGVVCDEVEYGSGIRIREAV
jgi:hypothetical protein